MHILSFSSDITIFDPQSSVAGRWRRYSSVLRKAIIIMPMRRGPVRSSFISPKVAAVTLHPWQPWKLVREIREIRRLVDHDVVNIVDAQSPFLHGLVAYVVSRVLQAALHIQMHGDFFNPNHGVAGWRATIGLFILQRADAIRAVSERAAEHVRRCGIAGEKITVVPIYADVLSLQRTEEVCRKETAFVSADKRVLLWAGRLVPEKNPLAAVRIFRKVRVEAPNAVLLIVGDGPLRQEIEHAAADLIASGAVYLRPWTNNISCYFRRSHLSFLTSLTEGWGRSVIESLFFSCPVVMNDAGLAGEIVVHEESALIVPPGDEKAMTAAIVRLLKDDNLRHKLQTVGFAAVKNTLSPEETIRRYEHSWQLAWRHHAPSGRRLLLFTQAVDLDDPVMGFFHDWIVEAAKNLEKINVVCLKKGRYTLPANVRVHSLGKESGQSRRKYLWRFYKYIYGLRHEYDSVYVHMNKEYVLMGALMWRLWRKRVVFWYAHYRTDFLVCIAARLAHRVVTSVASAANFASGNIRAVGQAIRTDEFHPTHATRPAAALLSLGRLDPIKRVHLMIQAFATLALEFPQLSLTIVGDPGRTDHTYGEIIKWHIAKLTPAVQEKITLRPGVAHEATNAIYNEHDIFLNATYTGCFDKTTLEAMAAGTLVAVSNPAYYEILPPDFHDYMIYKENDIESFIVTLRRLLLLPLEKQIKMRNDLREIIVHEHSLPVQVKKVVREFR